MVNAQNTSKPSGKFQIPADWDDQTSQLSGTRFAIIGVPAVGAAR
jgi:hypothetical protein